MKRIALAAASIFAIGACSAGTYTVDSLAVSPGPPYNTLSLSGPLFNDASTIAGLMTVGTTSGQSFETFCVDLSGTIDIGADNLLDSTSPTLPTNGFGTPVSVTVQRELQALANLGLMGGDETALQGAIWRLEYPTESVMSSNAAIEAAIGVDAAWAVLHPASPTSFFLDSPVGAQNLIIGTTGSVPETQTWLMMLAGLAALAAVGWRKAART